MEDGILPLRVEAGRDPERRTGARIPGGKSLIQDVDCTLEVPPWPLFPDVAKEDSSPLRKGEEVVHIPARIRDLPLQLASPRVPHLNPLVKWGVMSLWSEVVRCGEDLVIRAKTYRPR